MPHHQKKLMVEELLVDSGLPYTVIQPAVFMQNILESWKSLNENGIFKQRFFTSPDTRMCLLDLDDLAEAVSIILTSKGFTGSTYELCGSENLSLSDMLSIMEKHFGHEIKAERTDDETYAEQLKKVGVGDYQASTLLKMFRHYNEHGFVGNSNVCNMDIGQKAKRFFIFHTKNIEKIINNK